MRGFFWKAYFHLWHGLWRGGQSRIMTTPLLVNTDSDEPESTDISFVLHQGRLVTLRDTEPQSFRKTI